MSGDKIDHLKRFTKSVLLTIQFFVTCKELDNRSPERDRREGSREIRSSGRLRFRLLIRGPMPAKGYIACIQWRYRTTIGNIVSVPPRLENS